LEYPIILKTFLFCALRTVGTENKIKKKSFISLVLYKMSLITKSKQAHFIKRLAATTK